MELIKIKNIKGRETVINLSNITFITLSDDKATIYMIGGGCESITKKTYNAILNAPLYAPVDFTEDF